MRKTILYFCALAATTAFTADWDSDARSTFRGVDAGGGIMSTVSNNVRTVAIGNAAANNLSQSEDTVLIGADSGRDASGLKNCVGIGSGAFMYVSAATNAVDIAGMISIDGNTGNFFITPDPKQRDMFAPISYHAGQLLATGDNVIVGGASNVVINAMDGKIILAGEVEINGVTFSSDGSNVTATASGTVSYVYGNDPGYNLYVATYGRDTANGTRSDPLRTIDAAVAVAREGDSICVMPGTYAWPTSFSNTLAHTISQGYDVSNKYVRIISQGGRDKTFLRGTNGVTDVMHGNAFTDLPVIDGFTLTGIGLDTRSGFAGRMIGAFSTMDFRNCRIVMTNDFSARTYNVRPFIWCALSNCVVSATVSGDGTTSTYEMDFAYGCEFADSVIDVKTVTGKSPLTSGKNNAFDNCFVTFDKVLRTVFYPYSGGVTFYGRTPCVSNSTVTIGAHQTGNTNSRNLGGSLFVGPCLGSTSETDFRACTTNDVAFGSDLRAPIESRYRLWGYKSEADRALVKSAMRWYYDEARPNETRLVTTNGTVHVYNGATDLGTLTLGN